MPTGGFVGYAPLALASGNAGANSIFLTPITAPQNGVATAVLIHSVSAASGISFKALIYDGSHSVLLATSSAGTSLAAGYNRLPLTSNLNLVAGTTYYVGYVCNASLNVGVQTSSGPGAWFVSGGQSVASPANPLASGVSNAATILVALELDGTGVAGFGWGPDQSFGFVRSASNTIATSSSSANQGVRGIVTQVNGAGKFYAEVDIGGTINSGVGVGLASVNLGVTQGMPASATNPGYAGLLYSNGQRSGAATLAVMTYVSGDTIGIAYDCVNKLLWWNKNNGAWWGIAAAAGDPVAGTNGFSFNPSTWPMAIVGVTQTGTPAIFTLRDTVDRLRYAPPSGYSPWSAALATPPVDFAGNLGGISSYGKLSYGLKKYSRVAAFAPVFGADLTVPAGAALSGDLAPTVSFGANFGVVFGVSGDLVPAILFAADLDVSSGLSISAAILPLRSH